MTDQENSSRMTNLDYSTEILGDDQAPTVSAMPPPMIVANAYSEEAYAPPPPSPSYPRGGIGPRHITSLGIAAALVAVAVAGAAALGVLHQPSPTTAPPRPVVATTVTRTAPATVTVTEVPPPTVTVTAAPIPTITTTVPATTVGSVSTGATQLRSQADTDSPYVAPYATGQWFPQISSKQPGTVDDGITWGYDSIWREHQALRQRYQAVLLWSGDWPATFRRPDYWVTLAWFVFPDAAGAKAWCVQQGLDADHCFPVQLR